MIDARYQHKGYGRVAMEAVISRIRQQESSREIRLSYHPDNTIAAHLYERLGFRPTGELRNGEIVVRLAGTGGHQ
jgi:diamine N-acetyltransferase